MATIHDTLRLLAAYGWRQHLRIGDVRVLTNPGMTGVRIVLKGLPPDLLDQETLKALLERAGLGEDTK